MCKNAAHKRLGIVHSIDVLSVGKNHVELGVISRIGDWIHIFLDDVV